MKKKSFFPVLYMFVITAVCSAALIALSNITRPRVEANQRLEFEKAVLSVLPIDIDLEKTPGLEIHKTFIEKISNPDSAGGAYILTKDNQILAYAIPVAGKGFWAPIKGIIGISADRRTLTGISFYEQSETPGLGAEISKPQFSDQFKIKNNRVLAETDKPLRIVRPGTELEKNYIYAVTGATQTSTRLEKLINDDILKWQASIGSGGNK